MDSPMSVTFTFAAVDEGEQVADAIGNAFDAVLMATKQGPNTQHADWQQGGLDLDYRILIDTGWNIVDSSTVPVDLFCVGSGVQIAPGWS